MHIIAALAVTMPSNFRDIWTELYAGRAWECRDPNKISVALLHQLEIEWSQRADLFELPQFKKDVTILENERMEYKFNNDNKLFRMFLEVSSEILASHKSDESDSHSKFLHLTLPADDLSVLSVFRMEEGSSVPMHEDRGILTFVYSPTDSNLAGSGSSSFSIMAGSTLSACSNHTITSLSHKVPVVTTKYRYSFVFRLRGCSTAQIHKTGMYNLSVGEYLKEFQTIRTSVNIPKAIEVVEVGLAVTSFTSDRFRIFNNPSAAIGRDKFSNGSTINFIRNLVVKRDREIADLKEMHQDGSLTKDEFDILCHRSRDEFQDAKRQRISEGSVQATDSLHTTNAVPWQNDSGAFGETFSPEAVKPKKKLEFGLKANENVAGSIRLDKPTSRVNSNQQSKPNQIQFTPSGSGNSYSRPTGENRDPRVQATDSLHTTNAVLAKKIPIKKPRTSKSQKPALPVPEPENKSNKQASQSSHDSDLETVREQQGMNDEDQIDCETAAITFGETSPEAVKPKKKLEFGLKANENVAGSMRSDKPASRVNSNQQSKPNQIQFKLSGSGNSYSRPTGENRDSNQLHSRANMNDEDQIDCETAAIAVTVKAPSGEAINLKIKMNTKMDKIFNAIATRLGVERDTLKFFLDGASLRYRGEQTPYMLDMVDGDQIDCLLEICGD